jgi:rubrerythrin
LIGRAARNLQAAAEGEKLEWGTLYPNFAEVTKKKEGFVEIANTFREIASVETHHEQRYLKLLDSVRTKSIQEIHYCKMEMS